jgi:hypothetical protein
VRVHVLMSDQAQGNAVRAQWPKLPAHNAVSANRTAHRQGMQSWAGIGGNCAADAAQVLRQSCQPVKAPGSCTIVPQSNLLQGKLCQGNMF